MARPRTKTKPKRKAPPKRHSTPAVAKHARAQRTQEIAAAAERARVDAVPTLGVVGAPSGKLVIFDIGLFGYLPRDTLAPLLITANVPADRPLRVTGTRVGKGRFADCWDHVAIELGAGEPAHWKKLGSAAVDFARLAIMDEAALDHWQHEDSLDGRADLVFSGRDQAALAKTLGAKRMPDGFGWTDLPVADAEAKADRIAALKSQYDWALAAELRPHTHHFQVLAAARASTEGSGVIEVGGYPVLVFFTRWGDGVFPIYLDTDHDDAPVRIRIQLATEESVNPQTR